MGRSTDPVALFDALAKEPYRHDFYATMRQLECLYRELPRLGEGVRIADEPIRLGQDPSLAFAPSSIAAFEHGEDGAAPRILVSFFGLLGPNGPMPLHFTEFVRERVMHHGDPTLARFLDVFHHRFLALFYRAWAQGRPTVSLDRPARDRFAAFSGSLIGVGTRRTEDRDSVPDHAKLYFSGILVRQTRNAEGLAAILAGFFRVPARIEQFVGHWMPLPASERTRLSADSESARLGVGAVIGTRVWDRQHKFRIHLGPLTFREYEALLPGGEWFKNLVDWVRQYCHSELDWDVRLTLKRANVPRLRLGRIGRLGWTTWLGQPPLDIDPGDLTLDAERLAA